MSTTTTLTAPILREALAASVKKLSPRAQFRNPVMFVVFVCSALTTALWAQALAGHGETDTAFIFWIALWLWFTLVFANFAEAIAEGRGKAQAQALRGARREVVAKKLASDDRTAAVTVTSGADLRVGQFVLVEAGDVIPGDGEVVDGAASVDESAVTGESRRFYRRIFRIVLGKQRHCGKQQYRDQISEESFIG